MSGVHQMLVGGRGGVTIALSSYGKTDNAVSPTDARVDFDLENDGDISWTRGSTGVNTILGEWMSPKDASIAANYECRVTVTAGGLTGGSATGSWLNLGTSRSWYVEETTNGEATTTATFTVEIRDATTLEVLATGTVTITARVSL